ncbi:winged helix-turn-helix transcriptional regulator [Ornithinimicrobium cavernae]|uniref:winged helix-turn-helix transcriptional regulator n=1 Tax=Ornithinimicrobium cavernae TaxID=2666047 RepID=UPI000D691018|nr:helix-turn-helix domain-containing protein [Ornithinimicrobium cavernae]
MLGKTYDSQVCSIARALELVGERWSLLIVRDALFAGVTRFSDFQHNLGIATNVLQSRLDGFVEAGLMERHGQSRQRDYVLTEMGRGLAPALVALTEWGDRWAAPGEPPILYRHAGCAEPVHAVARCAAHGELAPDDITVAIGPGMPADYLAGRRPRRDSTAQPS